MAEHTLNKEQYAALREAHGCLKDIRGKKICDVIADVEQARMSIEYALETRLDVAKRELYDLMSALSQEYFSGGWVDHLEHYLWNAVNEVPLEPGVSPRGYKQAELDRLSKLYQETNGWWVSLATEEHPAPDLYDYHALFMSKEEWLPRHAAWTKRKPPWWSLGAKRAREQR